MKKHFLPHKLFGRDALIVCCCCVGNVSNTFVNGTSAGPNPFCGCDGESNFLLGGACFAPNVVYKATWIGKCVPGMFYIEGN